MKTLLYCCLFCLPLKHLVITSEFGNRTHPITKRRQFHFGTDFRARSDTVYAIISARAKVAVDPTLGIHISLVNNDFQITYGHLSQVLMTGSVTAGDPIAITGYAKCLIM